MNPDTIECVWTGEFDFNTLRVDGEIFESGKKKLRIQKYPDKCGRGLNLHLIVAEHHSACNGIIYSCFEKGCPTKPYATMSQGIIGSRGSWFLIEALGVSAT